GVRLDCAYHNRRDHLVSTGRVTGAKTDRACEQRLEELLKTNPVWQARAAAGVMLQTVDIQPREPQWAGRALAHALAYARLGDYDSSQEWVALALTHDPSDSTAWFLSAMYHYAKNDPGLVDRDLRRVLGIEKLFPS